MININVVLTTCNKCNTYFYNNYKKIIILISCKKCNDYFYNQLQMINIDVVLTTCIITIFIIITKKL
jgi:hypothetical protein